MIYGVIDVGSNTIRLCIYDVDGGSMKQILNHKTTAGLIGYVKNRKLSKKGIRRACEVLADYKKVAEDIHVSELFVFATASLRNIDNTEEAVEEILRETGIQIDVLTGEEEAEMDFYGAVSLAPQEEGLLMDIGGGSTELLSYGKGDIMHAVSLDFGSLSIFSNYVSHLFPTAKEEETIRKKVSEAVRHCGFGENQVFDTIIGIGGSIRAAKKLSHNLLDKPRTVNVLTADDISALLEKLRGEEKKTLRRVLRAAPERIHTLIPGMIILDTICGIYSCKEIQVSTFGVREGYLHRKVMLGQ